MGQRLLSLAPDDLESLRIASNLGEGVLVEHMPSPEGPTPVIAAGTLLFTPRSFITFWLWLCMGGKWYQAQACKTTVEHELVQDMRLLNPLIHQYVQKQDPNFVPDRFVSFLFTIFNRKLKNLTPEERFSTFERVLAQLP
jgi:hypothetical protein